MQGIFFGFFIVLALFACVFMTIASRVAKKANEKRIQALLGALMLPGIVIVVLPINPNLDKVDYYYIGWYAILALAAIFTFAIASGAAWASRRYGALYLFLMLLNLALTLVSIFWAIIAILAYETEGAA